MHLLWDQRDKIQAIAVWTLFFWAWRKGSGPERWCASVLAGMLAALWLFKLTAPPNPIAIWPGYAKINPLYFGADIVALGLLTYVGLNANRLYPLLLAGCQLTSVMAHFASLATAERFPLAYALANILPFYCMIVVMAVGLAMHVRRDRLAGPYRSWRDTSSHLRAERRPQPPSI